MATPWPQPVLLATCRELPFRLGRQPHACPCGVCLGVFHGDVHDGMVGPWLVPGAQARGPPPRRTRRLFPVVRSEDDAPTASLGHRAVAGVAHELGVSSDGDGVPVDAEAGHAHS
jgi:hypothetical protein